MSNCLATAFLLLVSGVAMMSAVTVAGEQPSKFKITAKREDDSVEVRADKDKTLIVVKSPSGISQAVIERKQDKWPAAVMLRLHLKGLESFRASNGKVTLDASVSVQDGKPKVRMWKDGKEDTPLDANSLFWMEIRILTSDGKPTKDFPLNDRYFEIMLPRAFFDSNPRSITLGWIDFYRN